MTTDSVTTAYKIARELSRAETANSLRMVVEAVWNKAEPDNGCVTATLTPDEWALVIAALGGVR